MDLKLELKKRQEFFDKQLEKFLKNDHPKRLYDAARHLPLAGGKRLRPVLSMISCESVGGDVSRVVPLSIAIELIHNFTLVHDDIMDKSELRRNMPAVHVEYGEPTAIMAGDLLFAKGFESIHRTIGDCDVFKNVEYGLIDTIREICEGQQLDMDFEKETLIPEEKYLEMILKKTAVFFQYSCEAGAILGGADRDKSNALNEYGKHLGLAFQIHDDYLDMSSDAETLGKDIGNDIRNGKKTLIAVHALNNAKNDDLQVLKNIFGKLDATDDEIKKVYNVFRNTGSIDYAKNTALKHCDRAKKALSVLSDSDSKNILIGLAEYSITREK